MTITETKRKIYAHLEFSFASPYTPAGFNFMMPQYAGHDLYLTRLSALGMRSSSNSNQTVTVFLRVNSIQLFENSVILNRISGLVPSENYVIAAGGANASSWWEGRAKLLNAAQHTLAIHPSDISMVAPEQVLAYITMEFEIG